MTSRFGSQLSDNEPVPPLISTTILSWNRARLLQRTLDSYVNTVSAPYELFIVDNGSSDGSRQLIQQFCAARPGVVPILSEENLGGEAINLGLERSRGSLLHISENDVEYRPGWCQKIRDTFEVFPELGQLSVFGPVPSDDEVWAAKPCSLRHRQGCIIYVTEQNVGTTSVLRRELWEKGVRVHNLQAKEGSFLFPDDGRLSVDIRALGMWVAWADKYLVSNLGHMGREIEEHPEYYLENYRSKEWLGVEGLRRRMDEWQSRVTPIRKSVLVSEEILSPEMSLPSPECPFPQRWSMIDGKTPELETLEFLFAVVRLLKPRLVVETGTWHGYSAIAIASALRQNGFGKLITFETDTETCAIAQRRLAQENLTQFVDVRNETSVVGSVNGPIDLLLLDSELPDRISEFEYFRPQLSGSAIVIFHDTSTIRSVARDCVQDLVTKRLLACVMFPSPRGLAICQYQGDMGG